MKKLTQDEIVAGIFKHKQKNPSMGYRAIAKALGLKESEVQRTYFRVVQAGKLLPLTQVKRTSKYDVADIPHTKADIQKAVRAAKDLLSRKAVSKDFLADTLRITTDEVDEVVKLLSTKSDLSFSAGLISLVPPQMGKLSLDIFGRDWNRVGLVADTHLCCKEQRLDELHAQYDLFEREGITRVFHAGNMVDGFIEKINGESALCLTPTDQTQYVIDHYPRRKGITTYFITGDDHEGWWKTINWGRDTQREAEAQGRDDLKYIGHVEADVEFRTDSGAVCIWKIQHPGGGSAYARSYTGQKQVEAFESGEKPAVLIQGHYHVSNYMNDRSVHVVSMPGFQDQTIFARKKRLRMEVGGAIADFTLDAQGSVARFRIEWNRYFTRGYYKPFLKSDARCLKGHLVVKAN